MMAQLPEGDIIDPSKWMSDVRPHPQTSFVNTTVDPNSFWGKLRAIYSEKVLRTQLEQLRKQGSYDCFNLKWHASYDKFRLEGGKVNPTGQPPSLFWESDVGKWMEGVCYFLQSPDGASSPHKAEFDMCLVELVDMIASAQQPDGYLNVYFTVVDPAGRFKNFRDMHELYNAGHLLEAAMAHHAYTRSSKFLEVMKKNMDCLIKAIGPGPNQIHAYPGHPELELAILRLAAMTKDARYPQFGNYLLSERGRKRPEFGDEPFFIHEPYQRRDLVPRPQMNGLRDVKYHSAHLPLHEQQDISGHSVRAFYLTTGAADLGGPFLDAAERMWTNAVDKKMYVIGGFGSEPRTEGFHPCPHRLPDSTQEGGCYQETCAAIAAMMTSERLLSHQLEGRVRDVMELSLYNAVIGGGSLDGKQFAYDQKLATSGDETAFRHDWFTVCCCPPNLSRTLGMLGGYQWSSRIEEDRTVAVDVYLFISSTLRIQTEDGAADLKMQTDMPWTGKVDLRATIPNGWKMKIRIPTPEYAEDIQLSTHTSPDVPGYTLVILDQQTSSLSMTFDLPVRLLSHHPLTGHDTLTVSRGPIIYTAESIDNPFEEKHRHFEGIGVKSSAKFRQDELEIEGIRMIGLEIDGSDGSAVYVLEQVSDRRPYRAVNAGNGGKSAAPARSWTRLEYKLVFVPWFARANRVGAGRLRTSFLRVDEFVESVKK